VRDKFLAAVEARDHAAIEAMEPYLVGCDNLLPSGTCALLGLTPGSTYGQGFEATRNKKFCSDQP
jgi:hypothetical protein